MSERVRQRQLSRTKADKVRPTRVRPRGWARREEGRSRGVCLVGRREEGGQEEMRRV